MFAFDYVMCSLRVNEMIAGPYQKVCLCFGVGNIDVLVGFFSALAVYLYGGR